MSRLICRATRVGSLAGLPDSTPQVADPGGQAIPQAKVSQPSGQYSGHQGRNRVGDQQGVFTSVAGWTGVGRLQQVLQKKQADSHSYNDCACSADELCDYSNFLHAKFSPIGPGQPLASIVRAHKAADLRSSGQAMDNRRQTSAHQGWPNPVLLICNSQNRATTKNQLNQHYILSVLLIMSNMVFLSFKYGILI